MELLADSGYHGTGLKKILDRVKVPKGSFYNYFASKEIFVSEIIKEYNRDVVSRLDDYIQSSDDDPVTMIRCIHKAIINDIEAKGMKGCLVGNLAAEIGNSSVPCQVEMKTAFEAWEKRFVLLIEKAQEEKLLRDDMEASDMAQIFWSAWQGGLLKMKIDGNTDHLNKVVSLMIDSLFSPSHETRPPVKE
jgi:TetR/AcrR family transcriptional repressor of nem operon